MFRFDPHSPMVDADPFPFYGTRRDEHPWFWSDQYDVKLQMAGRSSGYDHVVIRGAIEERKFSAFYFRGDRRPTPAQAADTEFALASLRSG